MSKEVVSLMSLSHLWLSCRIPLGAALKNIQHSYVDLFDAYKNTDVFSYWALLATSDQYTNLYH